MDFGDRLAQPSADARLVLFAYGWVEYGYSSTNFAAYQAGMSLQAPTIQVERDGRWVDVLTEAGYPAGLEHVMTLDGARHRQQVPTTLLRREVEVVHDPEDRPLFRQPVKQVAEDGVQRLPAEGRPVARVGLVAGRRLLGRQSRGSGYSRTKSR